MELAGNRLKWAVRFLRVRRGTCQPGRGTLHSVRWSRAGNRFIPPKGRGAPFPL